jgi:hypothetical protein
MAEFHFVEDYELHVEALLKAHSIDEAMSLAVGGLYDSVRPRRYSTGKRSIFR